jgi:hypothetical protein
MTKKKKKKKKSRIGMKIQGTKKEWQWQRVK